MGWIVFFPVVTGYQAIMVPGPKHPAFQPYPPANRVFCIHITPHLDTKYPTPFTMIHSYHKEKNAFGIIFQWVNLFHSPMARRLL
jgi:hypothetical protein